MLSNPKHDICTNEGDSTNRALRPNTWEGRTTQCRQRWNTSQPHKGHSASPEGSLDAFQREARSQAASESGALCLTPTCGSIIFSKLSVYSAPRARASSILSILSSCIKEGWLQSWRVWKALFTIHWSWDREAISEIGKEPLEDQGIFFGKCI